MTFVPKKGFEESLEAQPESIKKREEVAETIASYTIGLAPRGVDENYAASIAVVTRGAKVLVRSNDLAGHMVEWGSANNPPYAPIRRAVRAAGLRLEEETK